MTISEFHGAGRFLSNFWLNDITYNDVHYISAEHAYQAAKSTNKKEHDYIAAARMPYEAKRRGRAATHLRKDWDEVKDGIMEDIVWAKFLDPDLRRKLLATDDAELIEGNTWHDTHFGICNCSEHKGIGSNVLGKILMKVRTRIRKELKEVSK